MMTGEVKKSFPWWLKKVLWKHREEIGNFVSESLVIVECSSCSQVLLLTHPKPNENIFLVFSTTFFVGTNFSCTIKICHKTLEQTAEENLFPSVRWLFVNKSYIIRPTNRTLRILRPAEVLMIENLVGQSKSHIRGDSPNERRLFLWLQIISL